MKKAVIPFLFAGMCLLGSGVALAQSKPQKEAKEKAEDEKPPLIFKFEPEFTATEEAERQEFLAKRALIDSLDISDNRRLKLIRDLYRNRDSRRLNKILLADTKFEDIEK